jgi:hypothetical protein
MIFSPSRVLVSLLVAATLAYYAWLGMMAAGGLPRIHGRESDYFNLLSRGFKQGHLYLDATVPAGLLQARNPYDPGLRATVPVLHDATYYRGHYYIYFGPAPVVTLMLPFTLMTGRDLPLPYAVGGFTAFGYLGLVALFRFLQRRYYPAASLWSIAASLCALGGATMTVALLRRSHIWELSAASGFGYFTWSLYALIRALHSTRPARWTLAGGLALGLAVASRPTYIVCCLLFALPWLPRRADRTLPFAESLRAILSAALGCGLLVGALLVYNYARFGHFLEFGQKYQLSAIVEGDARHFSLAYVPFNFHVYFLSILRWLPLFPFHDGIVVPRLPEGFGGYEYVIGTFTNLPFSLFAFVPLIALGGGSKWLRHPADSKRFRDSAATPAAALAWQRSVVTLSLAVVLNAGLLLCFFGSCIRYMIDFLPALMVLAALGLCGWEARLRPGPGRGAILFLGLGLAAFSSFAAAMSVVRFYDPVPGEYPRAYRPWARALNRPAFWWRERRWPDSGPREITLTLPAAGDRRQESLLSLSQSGRVSAALTLDYLDAGHFRLGYVEPGTGRPAVFSPAVAASPGSRHTLQLSVGGPYSDFNGERGRLRAQVDDRLLWDADAVSPAAYPGEVRVGKTAPVPGFAAFSGEVQAVRRVTFSALPRPHLEGIRVRLNLSSTWAGRSFPLLTTGQTKAGDLLFVRVQANDRLVFGYDHWGAAVVYSPEVAIAPGSVPSVEFWVPALVSATAEPNLIVRVNGATVWAVKAAAFPVTPETVFLGANPIGGSTCEPALEHGVFEELALPLPPPPAN